MAEPQCTCTEHYTKPKYHESDCPVWKDYYEKLCAAAEAAAPSTPPARDAGAAGGEGAATGEGTGAEADAVQILHNRYGKPSPDVYAEMAQDDIAEKALTVIEHQENFAGMTNRELVAECLKSDAADFLVVTEMMNRLDPQWADEMRIGPAAAPAKGEGAASREGQDGGKATKQENPHEHQKAD